MGKFILYLTVSFGVCVCLCVQMLSVLVCTFVCVDVDIVHVIFEQS